MIDGDARLVLLMLLASGVLYDGAVNFTQRQLPSEHGVTSFLVAGGVLWTLFGLLLIEGVRVFLIALLCFVAVYQRMVYGEIDPEPGDLDARLEMIQHKIELLAERFDVVFK